MIVQTRNWVIDEPWVDLAACRNFDPMLFFPPPAGDERTPLAICENCCVVEACLDYALRANERWGVWGGTTQRYRRNLSRRLRRRAA